MAYICDNFIYLFIECIFDGKTHAVLYFDIEQAFIFCETFVHWNRTEVYQRHMRNMTKHL